jgi:subtilase family serine protease
LQSLGIASAKGAAKNVYTVRLAVHNGGDGAAPPSVARIYITGRARARTTGRAAASTPGAGLLLRSVRIARLRRGATMAVRARVRLPRRSGVRELRVRLDARGAIHEYSEANNVVRRRWGVARAAAGGSG